MLFFLKQLEQSWKHATVQNEALPRMLRHYSFLSLELRGPDLLQRDNALGHRFTSVKVNFCVEQHKSSVHPLGGF